MYTTYIFVMWILESFNIIIYFAYVTNVDDHIKFIFIYSFNNFESEMTWIHFSSRILQTKKSTIA